MTLFPLESVMLGSAESEMVRLISPEIIFTEFQFPTYMHDHDTSTLQTDGRTNRGNTAL